MFFKCSAILHGRDLVGARRGILFKERALNDSVLELEIMSNPGLKCSPPSLHAGGRDLAFVPNTVWVKSTPLFHSPPSKTPLHLCQCTVIYHWNRTHFFYHACIVPGEWSYSSFAANELNGVQRQGVHSNITQA